MQHYEGHQGLVQGEGYYDASSYPGGGGYHGTVVNDYSYPPHSTASGASGSLTPTDEKKMYYGATVVTPERTPSHLSRDSQQTWSGSVMNEKYPSGLADAGAASPRSGYVRHPGAGGLDEGDDVTLNGGLGGGDDDLPPAIPRFPNGDPRPASMLMPGHVSRGSVALLAAAEGKIPKKEGLKMWRSDEHHGTFTRGGRGRTCLRCTVCTLIFAVILILGIIAAFLLWVRPPNVMFEGVTSPAAALTSDGFNLNLTLDISVSNPNFFGASFKQISAKGFYPTNTAQPIGGGTLDNVRIPAHSHNQLFFPFDVNYTKAIDPNSQILQDIAEKCGFIGNSPSNIKINYDLTLTVKIILFTISPTFSSSTSFACPLTQADVQSIIGGSDLSGLLGGSSSGASS